MSKSSRGSQVRSRGMDHDLEQGHESNALEPTNSRLSTHGLDHLARHQLYDAPMRQSNDSTKSNDTLMPLSPSSQQQRMSVPTSPGGGRSPTIKFGKEDVAHYYPSPGKAGAAIHEPRAGHYGIPPGASPAQRSAPPTAQSAPPSQPLFGNYGDPYSWRSPRSERGPTKAETLSSGFGPDDSLASLPTIGSSADVYDHNSPPAPGPSPRRYPTRGSDDDPLEHQRLVDRRDADSDSDSNGGAQMKPGGIRLLPKLPKPSDGI